MPCFIIADKKCRAEFREVFGRTVGFNPERRRLTDSPFGTKSARIAILLYQV